jgi:large subunit ribosomal protein L19
MAKQFTYNDQEVAVGDTVRIHQEVREGDNARMQTFEGIVIAIKNRGNGRTMTVRRIGVNGVGVEKILPVNLPSIKQIEVTRKGKVRRSKLYYLRNRVGKAATRIKEKDTYAKANSQTA